MKDIPLKRIGRFYLATSIAILFILVAFPQGSLALVFTNFSGGTNTSGSVNTANGYFDSDSTAYGYSGNRNVYVTTEAYGAFIFEPISRSAGISGTIQAIHSPTGKLLDSVVSGGYLYFTEGDTVSATLYKKKTRADTSMCESTDTGATGCIQTIDTNVGGVLRSFNGVLYYTSTTSLKHVDSLGNAVLDFTIQAPYQGSSQHMGMAVFQNSTNSSLEVYLSGKDGSLNPSLYRCTAAGCAKIVAFGGVDTLFSTYYATANTIYVYTRLNPAPTIYQKTFFLNGTSIASTLLSTTYAHNNRAYVGSMSTIGLYADSGTYSTFNSNEAGFDSLPVVPSQIVYDSANIQSTYTSYYNNSKFIIIYNIDISLALNPVIYLTNISDYIWQIDLIDPTNTPVLTQNTGQCSGILSCSVNSMIAFNPPTTNWIAGSWKVQLFEYNTATQHRALIATSNPFTVQNNMSTGGSAGGNVPITQPNSPVSTTEVTNLLTNNAFWALILVSGIMISIGLIAGKNGSNPVMPMIMGGFLALGVMTLLNWLPSWLLFAVILVVIAGLAWKLAQNQNTGVQ